MMNSPILVNSKKDNVFLFPYIIEQLVSPTRHQTETDLIFYSVYTSLFLKGKEKKISSFTQMFSVATWLYIDVPTAIRMRDINSGWQDQTTQSCNQDPFCIIMWKSKLD